VPAAPLREIASGGELSRVMLALLGVAHGGGAAGPGGGAARRGAGTARPGAGAAAGAADAGAADAGAADATLVFDEVDAGIGGHTARAVGAQLLALAEGRQIVCITHLPQIASLAARHFSIEKDTAADPARTTVRELRSGEVVAELVRMLGADADDAGARRHARELLKAA
jgi:DNA repair protein RecN (Recombination protein N)